MEATSKTCTPQTCGGDGLECAIKHAGIASVYCEEAATRSDYEDCRARVRKAYNHLSHCSDVHLADSHPYLAKKARDLRKNWEPVVYGRSHACPPRGSCEEIEEFTQELLHALEKLEGRKHSEELVAAQTLQTVHTEAFPWLLVGVAALAGLATFLIPARQ